MRSGTASPRPERALLTFAVSVFVFHQVPAFAGDRAGAAIDLLTPFAVVGSSAAVLAGLGARRAAVVVALVAGTLYVDGHGMHLAANSIHNEGATGADDVVYFWDERLSHIEAVLGWFGLVASFCLAEATGLRSAGPAPGEGVPPGAGAPAGAGRSRRPGTVLALAAALLGWTFFTSTVEGQTWWLELPATLLFAAWAIRAPRPVLRAAAGAFALGAALIGVWAIVNGGLPEFSDAELI